MARKVQRTDKDGRRTQVWVPDGAPEAMAAFGQLAGPPSLASLNLPKDTELRLHNGLHDRGFLTLKDLRANRMGVIAAIQSALRVDAETLEALYHDAERG